MWLLDSEKATATGMLNTESKRRMFGDFFLISHGVQSAEAPPSLFKSLDSDLRIKNYSCLVLRPAKRLKLTQRPYFYLFF